MTTDAKLKELYAAWDALRDIPVNDQDCLDAPFLHFPAGTRREKVWGWFEAQHPAFVVGEVISGIGR